MKVNKTIIQTTVYFVVTALLIAYFFPREGKFRYQFYEGKPWRYGLLTAPSDFPVYKSDNDVKAEKDSIRRKFEPYYRKDPSVKTTQIQKLGADYRLSEGQHALTPYQFRYLESRLNKIYDKGIVSIAELENLVNENHPRVYLIENNVSALKNINDFYSVKTAYEEIVNNAPTELDKSVLKAHNINYYITENVHYDQDTSDKMLNTSLQNIAISTGMVQAGERIVDRGEIIDNGTYNILLSLKTVYETKSGGAQRYGIIWAGELILVFGILFCCALYLAAFCPRIFYKRRNLSFILLCILTFCLFTEICVKYQLVNIYVIPFAILPIVVRTFFNSHTALFTHLTTVLLCSLVAPFPHEFLLLQIMVGIVVIFSLKELSQRSKLIRCAFFILITYALCYLSLSLYQEGDFNKINWMMMLFFGINFVLLMFSYILIYMIEKVFGYVSPITLVELSNTNMPLLKKLSENCPGTFQHSLQVSILASEAGNKIGADAQLIRTGALYHDIGKMVNPIFFTENQKSGMNPHEHLSFEESAKIIISHVTEGVKMAEKARLPNAVIDFIRTHHGVSKTKFFYNSFKNTFPDLPVNEKAFTYPGPNPFTKETGILMMADSVEATSRSLTEYTDETISALVDRTVNGQIADGLLKKTPLTFDNIEVIKATFVEKLKIMYHTRISYPDLIRK